MLDKSVFQTEFERWSGLWPAHGRKAAAYYTALQHLPTKRLLQISKQLELEVERFPTTKDIFRLNATLFDPTRANDPGVVVIRRDPGSGLEETCPRLNTLTANELRSYHESLERRFVEWKKLSHSPSKSKPMSGMVYHALARLAYIVGENIARAWYPKRSKDTNDLPF